MMRIVFEAALAAVAIICGVMWFVTNVEKTALVFYMVQKWDHTPTAEEFHPCVEAVLYRMLGRTRKG